MNEKCYICMKMYTSHGMSRKFNTKKFIKDVLNDKYALVIGNENILDKKIEPTGDVLQFFLRKVNDVSQIQYKDYYEIALDKGEKINPIRQLIEEEEIEFKAEYVSSDLKALLETQLFTTVLTTTTDGFLESVMRKIWKDKLRVVNIYDKESVDELQKELTTCRRGKKYNQPTLVYVFGKMDIDDVSKKYVRTDAEAIELIAKWIRMDVEARNEMLDFIRNKRLLALGCKYDNWYFRFFWYILTGVSKSCEENNYDGMGEVAFSIDQDDRSESNLLQFLNRTDICVLGDAQSFLNNITRLLTEESDDAPFRQQIIDSRRNGGVFISYCSKDALSACQLFFRLREKKYDVWLDNARLFGGDNYESEIADAIGSAKVVITLLSPHVAEDLKRNDTNHYYIKEWNIAQQFDNKTIIPLAINGYNLRAEYHQVYETIVNQQVSGIDNEGAGLKVDLMDADGFSKLISSINKHLQ